MTPRLTPTFVVDLSPLSPFGDRSLLPPRLRRKPPLLCSARRYGFPQPLPPALAGRGFDRIPSRASSPARPLGFQAGRRPGPSSARFRPASRLTARALLVRARGETRSRVCCLGPKPHFVRSTFLCLLGILAGVLVLADGIAPTLMHAAADAAAWNR